MGKWLQENQDLVMWIALLVVPILIIGINVMVQIKKNSFLTILLTAVMWVFLYDTLVVGVSLAVLLWGTAYVYLAFPVSVAPWLVAGATYGLERKRYEIGSIAARILVYNVVYYLAALCLVMMGLCVAGGLGWYVLLGLIPVAFCFFLYFFLGRRMLEFRVGHETVLFPAAHYEPKEICDYEETLMGRQEEK